MSDFTATPRLRFESPLRFRALRSALVEAATAHQCEQAAFLFASKEGDEPLTVVDSVILRPTDFVVQTAHHLELLDDVLQDMILRAHRTDTTLVEAHSHPTRGPRVRFSSLDRRELADLGPHVCWRLPRRPYVALVFGLDAFDSLYWAGADRHPRGFVDLLVGTQLLRASGQSVRDWRHAHG